MNLKDLKKDCAQKQQKGIHFIIASVVIWIMVLIVQLTDLPMLTKNLLTFGSWYSIMKSTTNRKLWR